MKKIALLFGALVALASCNNDDSNPTPVNTTVDFTFTQNWDDMEITNADYETTTYVTANGTNVKLSKLVYLISDITFTAADGTTYEPGDYNLVNARTGTNLNFTPNIEIPEGDYTVSFTFGFDDEDNDVPNGYADLNSSDGSWAVPAPLGGGYHYQRIEGNYINNVGVETAFQFHTVRANRHLSLPPTGMPVELQDTSFEVDLGTITIGANTTIEVEANIAEWFKNPNLWDLNVHYTVLMPKFDVQVDMSENGANGVFKLGSVTQ